MVDRTNIQLPPPSNWQDFERLCHHLFRELWNDPNTQRSGRMGQAQQGVDVFGLPQGEDRFTGVQCKGKDARFGEGLTTRELNEEVEKAKSFEPPLGSFIVATTAKSDARIQGQARRLTAEHRGAGLFSVSVWGWDEIHARLSEHPNVLRTHYPQLFPGEDMQASMTQLEVDAAPSQAALDDYTFVSNGGEQIAHTKSRDKQGQLSDFVCWHRAPTAWLRIIPPIPKAYGRSVLLRLIEGAPIPLMPFGAGNSTRVFPNGRGVVTIGFDGDVPEAIATRIAQVFRTGEIWAHNRALIEGQSSEQNRTYRIPWPALKQEFDRALANYLQFAQQTLHLATPVTVEAGLALVKGAQFVRDESAWHTERPKVTVCWDDFIRRRWTVSERDISSEHLLEPFYEAVFDACTLDYSTEPRVHTWPR